MAKKNNIKLRIIYGIIYGIIFVILIASSIYLTSNYSPLKVEVCNCGYVRCYDNGECGGRWADGVFSRETPTDICMNLLENESQKYLDEAVSYSQSCNYVHYIWVWELEYE